MLTFGLFSILVNAFLLQITDALSDHFTIDEFWWTAIWGAIIMAIVSFVIDMLVQAGSASPGNLSSAARNQRCPATLGGRTMM